ncbi:MAG: zinc-ribbon domain-containing protein [Myxococcaceae bacterium]|nr:zinc-ribbon domain-containing protein [Myxococcaceae bacterium]
MRVTCQKCSAAYAIDDKLVTPKGVRAQCPKCRHLQTVKNDGSTSPPSPGAANALVAPAASRAAAALPKSGFDAFGDLGPPSLAQNPETDFNFDFDSLGPPTGSHPSPVLAPGPAPAPAAPAPALDFDFNPPPVNPVAGAPGREMLDFGEFDLSGGVGTSPGTQVGGGQPLGLAIPKAAAGTPSGVTQCRSCGKALDDPFDQALGTCEECRARSSEATSSSLRGAPSGPVISESIAPSGELPALPEDGPTDDSLSAATNTSAAFRAPAPVRRANRTAASVAAPAGNRSFLVGALLTVLAVGGIIAFVFIKRPWVKKPPPLAARLPSTASKPIDSVIAKWKETYPNVTGSAAEHLAAGEEHLAKDTQRGYRDAEVEFQKALVLDKTSDRAVAGWALALAFGRGAEADVATLDSTEAMVTAAEQRSGDSRVYVAHAHLLLARGGNVNDVQALAERGKSSPSNKDKALAFLALSQAFMNKNPMFVEENIKQALAVDSKLKRAVLVQAKFALSQGRYKEAIALMEERLKADPDQYEVAEALATVYVDVGEAAQARRVLERARNADPRVFRPKLALAMFSYQHGGNVSGAVEQLDGLLAEKEKLSPREQAEAYLHLSAAERLNGDAEAAVDTASKGLKLLPDDSALLLHQVAAMIAAGKGGAAREALRALKGKLPDPAIELLLEGRALWAEGKFMDAYSAFTSAVEKDKRRIDALLLAAAAAAKAKRETQAYELVLKKGLHADPLQVAPALTMSRFFLGTAETLAPAKGAFLVLRHDALDPNPLLAEGLLSFHMGQLGEADKIFSQVLAADVSNAAAYAFRSLVAFRNNDMGSALKLAQRATDAERLEAQGQLALGLVLWASGKTEPAHKALKIAQEQQPSLLWGRVRLAELEVRLKKPDDARRLLVGVLLTDNSYREAKRALYKAGL